jgi:hypothetical protein
MLKDLDGNMLGCRLDGIVSARLRSGEKSADRIPARQFERASHLTVMLSSLRSGKLKHLKMWQ